MQLGKRMLRDHFSEGWSGLFGCFANKEFAEAQTSRYVDALKNCPIRIDETGRLTISELYRRVSIEAKKGNADIVIIDYLQLLRTTEKLTRYEQVTEISFQLKAMAKEFNITLIALSQLNRASCKDPSKPSLHDLRESGAIEQDADVVLLLGRPDEDGKEAERHVYVAKNRNGPVGTITLHFDREHMLFSSYNPNGDPYNYAGHTPLQKNNNVEETQQNNNYIETRATQQLPTPIDDESIEIDEDLMNVFK